MPAAVAPMEAGGPHPAPPATPRQSAPTERRTAPPPPSLAAAQPAAASSNGEPMALWVTLRDDGDRAAGQDLLRRMGALIQGMPGDDPVFLRIEGPSGGTLLALPEQWRTAANYAMAMALSSLLAERGKAELAAPPKNGASAGR